MSTMTITALPARVPRSRPAPRVGATASLVGSCPPAAAPLRLTARGRTVFVLLLALMAVAWSLGSGTVSLAGTTPVVLPVRYVTVEAGQSLWTIAGDVAPGIDPRVTVAQIRELNALPSSAVSAGQQLAVPAGR